MRTPRRQEPLIHRYYGLMLGFFLHLARLEVPAQIYQSHRSRINEVMRELDIDRVLPESHAQVVAEYESLIKETISALKANGAELADFFALGFHALRLLAGVDAADPIHDVVRKDFAEVIARYQLDGDEIHKVLERGWDAGRVDDAMWTELVGRFYRLAMIAIWPLKKQEGVCFVIMPFGEPFRSYYLDFYRPALRHAGYESIRAWVGLTNEFYLALLATLISRCSAALADVSPDSGTGVPNLNVIHEIGLNMGLENLTFVIRNQHDVKIPSNFTGLPILQYDPSPPEFPIGVAAVVGAHLKH